MMPRTPAPGLRPAPARMASGSISLKWKRRILRGHVQSTSRQKLKGTDMKGEPVIILLVEDDPAHAEIVRRNFVNFRMANRLMHVADGQQALNYLFRRSEFQDSNHSPRPNLILLDLRLPKVDGLEVLKTIKADADLARIPVVVLTTSAAEVDMAKAYGNHANSYLVKPVDFPQFLKLMDALGYYWLVWNQFPF
jgi:CheY-like chemotaxis protein